MYLPRDAHLKISLACHLCALLAWVCVVAPSACAQSSPDFSGALGLNVIPNARMDQAGTIRLGASKVGSYEFGTFGTQISDRLYLGVRQSSLKNPDTDQKQLFPGMDLKYRLFRERAMRPEISVGFQSLFGHKRMAAEYLALSKRYEQFDFTAGIGWGRLGTRHNIPNPLLLKSLSSSSRDLDGDNPSGLDDLFRGDAGIFAGIQYDIPTISGLSLKADLSSDGWRAEKATYAKFDAPSAWSIGVSYRPYSWLDVGAAFIGTDQIMTRLSFSPNMATWTIGNSEKPIPVTLLEGRPSVSALHQKSMDHESRKLGLRHIYTQNMSTGADLDLKDYFSTALQIGQGARHLSNISGDLPEQLSFHLSKYGLRGPSLSLNRRDIEMAALTYQGSPEEIWQNTLIDSVWPEGIKRAKEKFKESFGFRIDFKNELSLSEEDSGSIYRAMVVPSFTKRIGTHFITEQSLRINLANNTERIEKYRGISLLPIRSDISRFTRNRILFDRQYLAGFATIAKDVHVAGTVGYLEEMYAGLSGEILYRPFDKPWAIGLEVDSVAKRDPASTWALSMSGEKVLSAFVNGYYEIPGTGATFQASAGRFLAGDIGADFKLSNELDNGVILGGTFRVSNRKDDDIYGGKTNLYAGISVSAPLGELSFLPNGSRASLDIKPLGRDTAQRLDHPAPLYQVTEPLYYRSITRHWSELTGQP
ncbi:MAG: YjbH domain-containing protein [Pseudobdellovibrionaceae bacterium]|jgi:hypothetical protein|nr:YjbH domain-containing protein [Pseudobdellovibrionaceae bacterium]